MKYSRNPDSGEVEVYSDEGMFIGKICSMGDMVGSNTAMDGGAGSGNFGHSGRPGHRGGSAKRGGGSGGEGYGKAYHEKVKAIEKKRKEFKKMSTEQKKEFGRKHGFVPSFNDDRLGDLWQAEADRKNMTSKEYLEYQAARYFTTEKFRPEHGSGEYKTPLKKSAPQTDEINDHGEKIKKIQQDLGVDGKTASAMAQGLNKHFGSGHAVDPWIDRYIDADSRYEGPIYRWKCYTKEEAQEKLAKMVPGAKIENTHGSNWSFSSDPEVTRDFGMYDSHSGVTFCYVCDDNKTASPVQCFSGFGEQEAEVLPHSQCTWTIQSVVPKEKENGEIMYEIHMTEDDWHTEKNIPVWSYDKDKKDWTKNFPHDDVEADGIFQKIKEEHGDMSTFLDKTPDGTEIVSWDKHTLLHKENGEWYGVAVDIDEIDSFDDVSWDKLKDKAKPLGSAVMNTVYSDDAYIYDFPKEEEHLSFGEAKKRFDNAMNTGWKDTKPFLENAPIGTKFDIGEYGIVMVKQGEDTWVSTDGLVSPKKTSELLGFYNSDKAKLVDYPTTPQHEVGEPPKSYGEVEGKMLDLTSNQDYSGTELYLSSLPDGVEFYDEDKDEVWVKKDGMWENDWSNKTYDDEDMADTIISQQSFSVWTIPLEKPKTKSDAEKMMNDLIHNKPDKLGKFIGDMPEGTVIMDMFDADFPAKVYKKTADGWVSTTGENPTFSDSHEVSESNGIKVFQALKNNGSFIMKWGEGE